MMKFVVALMAVALFAGVTVALPLEGIEERTDYSCDTNAWDKPQYCLCRKGYAVKKMYSVHDNGREDRKYTLTCEKIVPGFTGKDSSYPRETSKTNWDKPLEFNFKKYSGFMVGMKSYHDNGREDRRFTFFYTKIDTKNWELNNCKWHKMNSWDKKMDYKLTGDQVFAGIKSKHDNGREDREWHAYVCDLVSKTISCKTNNWDKQQYCLCKAGYKVKKMYSVHDNGKEDRKYTLSCEKISPNFVGKGTYPSHTSKTNWDKALEFNFKSSYSGFMVGMKSYHDNGKEDRRFTFFYTKIDTKKWEFNNCKWKKMNDWDKKMDYQLTGDQVFAGIKSKHDNGREDRKWYAYICDLGRKAIHCKWNNWVSGECSKQCGTGTQINTRTKKVTEQYGGTCSGKAKEEKQCKLKECPVHCEWGPWTTTDCDKTCGGGTLTKTRTIAKNAKHGGNECTGKSTITNSCNVQECPVNCEWGKWDIGACSVDCGGGIRRNVREKIQVELYGGTCEGDPHAEEKCNNDPCPVHCVWGDWVIGECSETCGTGTRVNTRTKSIEEKHGGTCTGQPTETEECKLPECPVHCEWGPWEVTDCDKSCGGGTQHETRTISIDAKHGGEECKGESTITKSCNVAECPVDCKWSNWVESECSESCGAGVQIKTRTKEVEEQFGGQPCEGKSSSEHACNIAECPESCNGVPSTDWSCCSDTSPCNVGGGDCDRDSQCAGTLTCGRNNCRGDFSSSGSNWSGSADCCI